MGNPGGMLQDQVHVALLTERVVGCAAGSEGEHQGLVVGQDLEVSAFQERQEVTNGEVHAEELATEGAVALLGRRELPGEEGEWLYRVSDTLMEYASCCCAAGVRAEAEVGVPHRMSQECGVRQSSLGLVEGGFGVSSPRDRCFSRRAVGRRGQVVKRSQECSGVWDEAMVEVYHSQEPLQLLLGVWTLEVSDGGDSVLQGFDASGRDLVAEERDLGGAEDALGGVEQDAVAGEALEDLPQVLQMFVRSRAGDEDVVHVAEDVVEATQDLVHKPLEGLSTVAKTIRHPEELVGSEWGGDRSLRDVFRGHQDLVVGLHEVQLGVDPGTGEAGGEVVEVW